MTQQSQPVGGTAQQVELYGAPLGETVARICTTLGLNQARIAKILGMSAPMLSQLVTGARVKIGSPRSFQRLQSLVALADEVDRGLAHDRIEPALLQIAQQASGTLTQPAERAPSGEAASVQRLLRAVASGRELRRAADLLRDAHPDLADVLLVYGVGDQADAQAHYRSMVD